MAMPDPVGAPHFMRTLGANQGLLPGRRVSEGPVRGLTILVEFSDEFATVTSDDVNAMINSDNYRSYGNYCSVREYFRIMSNGKLDYANHVVGPIRLSRERAYYASHLLVPEALQIAVDDFNVDLAEFDSKNEGIVDALNFMYAGRTVYAGRLWPHNGHFNLTFNGIQTHYYMISSLGRHAIDMSIGTFCHENGHQLCRFPDLYDYGQRDGDFEKSLGIGKYCLMGYGNHNNHGRTPSPVCAYLRYLVNWHENEILINSKGNYEARHGDYANILKYETEAPNEFFLVENRSHIELDQHLPASGLAVYHCDTLGSNEWQGGTAERHYQCGLLQADGHLDLESNRNRGDSGDFYGQTYGVALSSNTTPSSRMWYGSASGLTIRDVGAPGAAIEFFTGGANIPVVAGEILADLLIPDRDPEGVESPIYLEAAGIARKISVHANISHTYIGDLLVVLRAPSGNTAVLHDKQGFGADDLREEYSSIDHENLKSLAGESIEGEWALMVKDLVRQDTGRLNNWKLEIEYEPAGEIAEGESIPHLTIPDYEPKGVSSPIPIAESGSPLEASVHVQIKHTYIGDLMVELVAPTGTNAMLHSLSGGGTDNLEMTYDHENTMSLNTLEINGEWLLRVRDMARYDEGVLQRWSLKLKYAASIRNRERWRLEASDVFLSLPAV